MIDWVELSAEINAHHLTWSDDYECGYLSNDVILGLSSKRSVFLDEENNITNISCPWHSLPSSHGSIAWRVSNPSRRGVASVHIKCSPAKLFQGHNVYGPDCPRWAINFLITEFCVSNPDIASMADWQNANIMSLDITYHSYAPTHRLALEFLHQLKRVSNGQTKDASHTKDNKGLKSFSTTAYWNPASQWATEKCYLKYDEICDSRYSIAKDKRYSDLERFDSIYTPELLDFCHAMLRWEVRIKRAKLERLKIPTRVKDFFAFVSAGNFDPFELWKKHFQPIFDTFKGQNMNVLQLPDEQLRPIFLQVAARPRKVSKHIEILEGDYSPLFSAISEGWKLESQEQRTASYTRCKISRFRSSDSLGRRAWETYQRIKTMGYDAVYRDIPRQTFSVHLKIISEVGISKATLQQYTGDNSPQIIPFVRFVNVDFANQYPLHLRTA